VFSGFRVALHLPGMTMLHSRNCQTLGVTPAEPGVYLEEITVAQVRY